MKSQSRGIATLTAALVLIAGGSTIFAAAVLKTPGPDGCIPYRMPSGAGDTDIAAALGDPGCGGFDFPDSSGEKWVESARSVLRRIEALEAKLDGMSPSDSVSSPATDGGGPACASPGLEIEKVLRRMRRIVETFRDLDADQKDMMADLTVERKIELLEEIGSRTERIESFISHLRERRRAHVLAESRIASATASAPLLRDEAAGPAPWAIESTDPSSANVPSAAGADLGEASRIFPAEDGGDKRLSPGAVAPAEDGCATDVRIIAAAAAVAADIMKAADSVAASACARQETAYRQNMAGDMGQVRFWKLQGRSRHNGIHAAELFCTGGGAGSGSETASAGAFGPR